MGVKTYCFNNMPAWCMSLHPYALRSSSKSCGIPSSRDGVLSTCSKEAKGYKVDAMRSFEVV